MPEFDVVDLGAADPPEPGKAAPGFTRPLVTDEFWENRSLASLRSMASRDESSDGRLLLVFTPMIGSFVAQYVWDELDERGWIDGGPTLVGVTASTPYAVSSYLDWKGHPFTIVADPANGVAEAYGIAHDLDGMAGVSEPRVAFVLLDGDGVVEDTWVAREWPEFPEYDELEDRFDIGV